MSARSTEQLTRLFQQRGAIVIARDEIPLRDAQWREIDSLITQMDFTKVVGGDTGDAHSVWVGRFINDVEKPEFLHPLARTLLDAVMSDEVHKFFGQILGFYPLCVRRCQANRLFQEDFIGYHIDRDTTPDYKATAVFQFSDDFEGGEFVLYHPEEGEHTIKLSKYSVLLNRGDIPHQVMPVKSGVRVTLACFFSENFGATRKPRSEIRFATSNPSY